MIRRVLLGCTLAALVATLVPSSAFAEHCDDTIVIFSDPISVNSNVICLVAGEDLGDTRIINPGSTGVSLRYTQDFGAGTPAITVLVNGLGIENEVVTLTRGTTTAGSFVYDSDVLAIDPAAVGCITAALTDEWGGADSSETAFHTVGSSC